MNFISSGDQDKCTGAFILEDQALLEQFQPINTEIALRTHEISTKSMAYTKVKEPSSPTHDETLSTTFDAYVNTTAKNSLSPSKLGTPPTISLSSEKIRATNSTPPTFGVFNSLSTAASDLDIEVEKDTRQTVEVNVDEIYLKKNNDEVFILCCCD